MLFLQTIDDARPYEWVLTRAVLRFPGFDRFLEGDRTEYITELLAATGCVEQALDLIERGLPRQRWLWRAEHLVDTACSLARQGNVRARQLVFDAFHRSHAEDEFFAADAIVDLDGLSGLVYVLESLGSRLAPAHADELHSLSWRLKERDGEEEAERSLSEAATDNSLVAEFLRCLKALKRRRKTAPMPTMSFAEFRRKRKLARKSRSRLRNLSPRGWAKSATPEQLEEAARALEQEHDLENIRWMARALRVGGYPLPIKRIAQRIKTDCLENAFFLAWILERTKSRSVRKLAFELFEDADRWAFGFGLLEKNLKPGDEHVLLHLLKARGTTGTDYLHGAICDIIAFDRDYPKLDWSPHLSWIYENSPCAYCRGSAVEELIERKQASNAMLEECLWDSQLETRKLAREALAAAAASAG